MRIFNYKKQFTQEEMMQFAVYMREKREVIIALIKRKAIIRVQPRYM
ncbi:hypothetical protein ACWKS2_28145 [Bacillus thuringiensis]